MATGSTNPSIPQVSDSTWQAAWMLAKREWIRFFRQPFRVVAAFGQPILFWLVFGTGFHSAFRGGGGQGSYMGFFIPGTAALILLFTAIFSTISIIEDRREGFLQGVLVSPSKRWGIAIGKALGGAAIA
ncbi:MAG: ABC transporter permease, partial [Pirellula sp.]